MWFLAFTLKHNSVLNKSNQIKSKLSNLSFINFFKQSTESIQLLGLTGAVAKPSQLIIHHRNYSGGRHRTMSGGRADIVSIVRRTEGVCSGTRERSPRPPVQIYHQPNKVLIRKRDYFVDHSKSIESAFSFYWSSIRGIFSWDYYFNGGICTAWYRAIQIPSPTQVFPQNPE